MIASLSTGRRTIVPSSDTVLGVGIGRIMEKFNHMSIAGAQACPLVFRSLFIDTIFTQKFFGNARDYEGFERHGLDSETRAFI